MSPGVPASFKSLPNLLMSLDESESHSQAQSECERGQRMVIDIGRTEKTGANTTMKGKLHTEVGLGFSGQGQRGLRLRGSTEFW